MGRPKLYTERIQLPLSDGTLERIDSVLQEDEYRLDLIRTAIEAEIEKRSRGIRSMSKAKDRPAR
jgi:hypothetical protein